MYALILSSGRLLPLLCSTSEDARAEAACHNRMVSADPDAACVSGFAAFYGDASDLDRAVDSGQPVYHLPSPGSGCRPSDDPFLALANRVLGSGVPLDALAKFDPAHDCEETWEIEYPDMDIREIEDEDEDVTGYEAYSDDGDELGTFDDEMDARDAIEERRRESMHGYPWAWNWAYCLTDYNSRTILDMVNAAGFVVAKHNPSGYTFCGVDGGGYDFRSSHHLPLGAALAIKWGVFEHGIPVGPLIPLNG